MKKTRASYVRLRKSHVVHFHTECFHVKRIEASDFKMATMLDRKPSGCTLCDVCQRIEKKGKRP